MAEHGGSILNIASIGGLGPEPGIGWYNVTKAAVIHTTSQLAFELAPGVRVNAIAPGMIATPLNEQARQNPDYMASFAGRIPLGRLGEPSDIAGAAVFLASDLARYVTAVTLPVDGGFLAY